MVVGVDELKKDTKNHQKSTPKWHDDDIEWVVVKVIRIGKTCLRSDICGTDAMQQRYQVGCEKKSIKTCCKYMLQMY